MNNKCSLKFGSNVFRLLSRVEALLLPSRGDANDKIVGGVGLRFFFFLLGGGNELEDQFSPALPSLCSDLSLPLAPAPLMLSFSTSAPRLSQPAAM